MIKIFNIGKANAELERVQKELDAANLKIVELEANAKILEKAAEDEKARADKAEESSKHGQSETISALTKERDDARAEATKAKADAEAHVKDFDAKVTAAAATKAQAITASLGVPAATGAAGSIVKVDFKARVDALVKSGKTKAAAIQDAIKSFPADYLEWRAGDTSKL